MPEQHLPPPALVPPDAGCLIGLAPRRPVLRPLTGIRFFAASYVVMFHTQVDALLYRSGHRWASNFVHNGYLAVPFFFLLSGFILAYTYAGKVANGSGRIDFWDARIARIWPTYVLSLLMSSLPGLTTPPLGAAIATLLMVQAWNPWNPDLAQTWNGMAWTLSAEAFFYLLFPWLQLWLDRLRRQALLILLAADLLLGVSCNIAAHGLDGEPYPGMFRFIPLPVIHLPEFIGGAAMGTLFLRSEGVVDSGAWTYVALGLSFAALMLPGGPWTSVALIGFSALIYCLARERTVVARVLSTRLLLFGGGISYAMYLLQQPVRNWVHPWITHDSRIPWQLAIVPIVLVALSAVVYSYYEGPARRMLRAVLARMRPTPTQG